MDEDKREKEDDNNDLKQSCCKVVVYNVFKFSSSKEMTSLSDNWIRGTSIVIKKVRKPPNANFVILTLESNDMAQPFIDLINNNLNGIAMRSNKKRKKGGQPLFAKRVSEEEENRDIADPTNTRENASDTLTEEWNSRKKDKRNAAGEGSGEHCTHVVKTPDEVRDVITPLWKVPYEKQLEMKKINMIKKCAMNIHKEIKSMFRNREREAKRNKHVSAPPLYDWLSGKSSIKVSNVVPSPFIFEYRNKVEFTFGYTAMESSKIPTVGYLSSGWAGGVSRPHDLQNTPSEACGIADIIHAFLQDCPLTPYVPQTHTGTWRVVTIRISRRTNQCMVLIQHASPPDSAAQEFESESVRLIEMLTSQPIPIPQDVFPRKQVQLDSTNDETETPALENNALKERMYVTSVYFQQYDGLSTPLAEHPVQHRHGAEVIEEKLGKCIFQISPGAFFQVNTAGAEILFQLVLSELRNTAAAVENNYVTDDMLLFDVCCGTGTIGLTCMKEGLVGHLVGVDISEPAIEDAKINAAKNGFEESTTRFVASRAEAVLAREIQRAHGRRILAVVDPAREGLHNDVLRTLRMNEQIQRLVYVSCNPTGSLVRDAAMLCAPPTKRYPGLPFKVTCAQPVDMFPLTHHCEMIMTFDRMTADECECVLENDEVRLKDVIKSEQL